MFDLIILGVIGFVIVSMMNRRRMGGVGGIVERIKREAQEALQQAQGIPAPNTRPQSAVRQTPQPKAPKTDQPVWRAGEQWQGLEGNSQPKEQAEIVVTQPTPVNPLPVISHNPVVQAVVLTEILSKPRAFGRGTRPKT